MKCTNGISGLLMAVLVALAAPAGANLITSAGTSGSLTGDYGGTALLFGVPGNILQGVGNSKVFLTLNQPGTSGTEQGYNTDGAVEYETIASGTESLLLSDVPLVNVGGTNYYEFAFALNQTGGSDQISINEVTIMQANAPNLTGYNAAGPDVAGVTDLVFDWTSNGEYLTVEDFVTGLSNVEMLMLVEASSFGAGDYAMLYMNAGVPILANDGPDKWIAFGNAACLELQLCDPPTQVPEPSTLSLLGGTLICLYFMRRRRYLDQAA